MAGFGPYCSSMLAISIVFCIQSPIVSASRILLLFLLPYWCFGTYIAVLLPLSSSSSSSFGLALTNSLIWSGSSSYSRWYNVRMSLVRARHLLRQVGSDGFFWGLGLQARRKATSARRIPDLFSFQSQIRQRDSKLIAAVTLFLYDLESQSRLAGSTQNSDYFCWIRVFNNFSQYFLTRCSSVSLSSARSPQVCQAPILAFSSPHRWLAYMPSKIRLRFQAE